VTSGATGSHTMRCVYCVCVCVYVCVHARIHDICRNFVMRRFVCVYVCFCVCVCVCVNVNVCERELMLLCEDI